VRVIRIVAAAAIMVVHLASEPPAGRASASRRFATSTAGMAAPLQSLGSGQRRLFVSSDCPISNAYAPEIQRLCGQFKVKGHRVCAAL
jgi:hypothetical protein